ncbi:hypothetical protein, partial [Bacillus paranthracis]|uniref:hypothetical protein n=1 Tax=Bacillus paranthracis TaxID=2026186 RepID=UPI00399F8F6E
EPPSSPNRYIILLQYVFDAYLGASPSLRFTPAFTIPPKNKGKILSEKIISRPYRQLIYIIFVIGIKKGS